MGPHIFLSHIFRYLDEFSMISIVTRRRSSEDKELFPLKKVDAELNRQLPLPSETKLNGLIGNCLLVLLNANAWLKTDSSIYFSGSGKRFSRKITWSHNTVEKNHLSNVFTYKMSFYSMVASFLSSLLKHAAHSIFKHNLVETCQACLIINEHVQACRACSKCS